MNLDLLRVGVKLRDSIYNTNWGSPQSTIPMSYAYVLVLQDSGIPWTAEAEYDTRCTPVPQTLTVVHGLQAAGYSVYARAPVHINSDQVSDTDYH